MRMLGDRRGAVHTLEALLAAAVLLSSLLYSASIPREYEGGRTLDLEALGLEVLLALDGNGTLGWLIENRGWGSLEEYLRAALPSWVSFNLTVYDELGEVVNDHPISNGGLVGWRVVSVDYLCVARSGSCPFYRVRLQIG